MVARKLRQDFELVEKKHLGVGLANNQKPMSYNFNIVKMGFVNGDYMTMWNGSSELNKVQAIPAISYYIETEHRPQRSLLMILLPLLLIWGVTYSSQWWKEESASSSHHGIPLFGRHPQLLGDQSATRCLVFHHDELGFCGILPESANYRDPNRPRLPGEQTR